MNSDSLHTLGVHLQQLRQTRGISLSQLAADAGIAKSNLSRIEQGKSNPTIDTLWRLAVQLEVPFGNLVAPMNAAVGDDDVYVRLIDQGSEQPRVDAYWMYCAANILHQSQPHSAGTQETITIISGRLAIIQNDQAHWLNSGDTLTFDSSQAHAYRTENQPAASLLSVIYDGDTQP